MMAGKFQADGSCRFDRFADKTAVSDENRWVVSLIGTCIRNDLPVELLPSELKRGAKTVSDWKTLGLFVEG